MFKYFIINIDAIKGVHRYFQIKNGKKCFYNYLYLLQSNNMGLFLSTMDPIFRWNINSILLKEIEILWMYVQLLYIPWMYV